jgi:hypothetical protein
MNHKWVRINLLAVVFSLSPLPAKATEWLANACIQKAHYEATNSWAKQIPRYSCPLLTSNASNSDLISTTMGKALSEISECMGMDWKKLFPKFLAESGFIRDIRGAGGDRGVGQLTLPAIRDVQKKQGYFWNKITRNSHSSCRRVEDRIQNFGGPELFFNFQVSEPCQLISGEIGLYRNIFFSLALTHLNQIYIDKTYQELRIDALLVEAGFVDAPQRKLKSILLILGYNGGGSSAVHDSLLVRLPRMAAHLAKKWGTGLR